MRTKPFLLSVILIISLFSKVMPQDKTYPKVSLRNTEVWKIQSSYVKNTSTCQKHFD